LQFCERAYNFNCPTQYIHVKNMLSMYNSNYFRKSALNSWYLLQFFFLRGRN
jgi:hypothetical protein